MAQRAAQPSPIVFSTRLDPGLVGRVNVYAMARGVPIREVVAEALSAYLPEKLEISEVAPSGKRKPLRQV
jgi:hypothetical protein